MKWIAAIAFLVGAIVGVFLGAGIALSADKERCLRQHIDLSQRLAITYCEYLDR